MTTITEQVAQLGPVGRDDILLFRLRTEGLDRGLLKERCDLLKDHLRTKLGFEPIVVVLDVADDLACLAPQALGEELRRAIRQRTLQQASQHVAARLCRRTHAPGEPCTAQRVAQELLVLPEAP